MIALSLCWASGQIWQDFKKLGYAIHIYYLCGSPEPRLRLLRSLHSRRSLTCHLCRLEVIDHFLQVVHRNSFRIFGHPEFLTPTNFSDLQVRDLLAHVL